MSIQDVRDFLLEFKQVATGGSGVDIVPRAETRPTLSRLGLTMANLEEILLGLSVADYCKGPEPDRDRPGSIWVFGREIEGHEVYIKLKVAQVRDRRIAKCISFHIAQYPLEYPHR
ncbi:MAG: hypothetical protein AB2717_17065 [Candidatus Thiodiazotropha sp.]